MIFQKIYNKHYQTYKMDPFKKNRFFLKKIQNKRTHCLITLHQIDEYKW
jgi:hypothetical protein